MMACCYPAWLCCACQKCYLSYSSTRSAPAVILKRQRCACFMYVWYLVCGLFSIALTCGDALGIGSVWCMCCLDHCQFWRSTLHVRMLLRCLSTSLMKSEGNSCLLACWCCRCIMRTLSSWFLDHAVLLHLVAAALSTLLHLHPAAL